MCPVCYELNGFCFVAFKLFSNAQIFEKEQTAQLVYKNKGPEDSKVIELIYRFLFRNLLSFRKVRNLLHFR